ncbi:tat pathway signal sequence [Colletotrichum graminicola M1.001]|uniref:Tat pathway signal sequence n=1 Tax=Colletotrichum graminicola (strain M1.001 / M2 / FGSC 10212) TaxID=645133 RepID=E3QMZ0_COLGM|nr:tat pathway signal sequence [Colletotrichum graminicola M1.001]EFQ32228.1 tat pathway signal sequence [Colletotrichum graminicola M1.001]
MPDPVTSGTSSSSMSRRNSQYQLPPTTALHPSLVSASGHPATDDPMDLGRSRRTGAVVDIASNGSSVLDIDLFTSVNDGTGSDMAFDWTNQPRSALEPLDNLLLPCLSPRSLPHSDLEEDISPAELSALHNHYFESIYFSFPFLNRDRFLAESAAGGGGSSSSSSPAVSALVYAVALAGCAHSPKGPGKQSTCYSLARNYAEKCGRDGYLNDLNFLQALLFIGRFEAMDRKLERSWLTLGRAAMLCTLLELPQMDQRGEGGGIQDGDGRQSGSRLCLPPTDDSRPFGRATTHILGANFRINLPSPGLLRSDLVPREMPFLSNISSESGHEISSYAGCVLMVELALRCFDHGQERASAGFWDGYCALVKTTDELFSLLKRHLNATPIRGDPVAFSMYPEPARHRDLLARGLPPLMTAESQRRATAAAFLISSAVRLILPSPWKAHNSIIMLQAIFIAWPLTMALKALYRELVQGGNRETLNGVVASSRLLLAFLDHIEESGGHWHQCVAHVEAKLQEWNEKNGFNSLAV